MGAEGIREADMTTTARPGLLPDPMVHEFTENEWSALAFELPEELAQVTASWGSDTVVLSGGLLEFELAVDVNHAAGVADALWSLS